MYQAINNQTISDSGQIFTIPNVSQISLLLQNNDVAVAFAQGHNLTSFGDDIIFPAAGAAIVPCGLDRLDTLDPENQITAVRVRNAVAGAPAFVKTLFVQGAGR